LATKALNFVWNEKQLVCPQGVFRFLKCQCVAFFFGYVISWDNALKQGIPFPLWVSPSSTTSRRPYFFTSTQAHLWPLPYPTHNGSILWGFEVTYMIPL